VYDSTRSRECGSGIAVAPVLSSNVLKLSELRSSRCGGGCSPMRRSRAARRSRGLENSSSCGAAFRDATIDIIVLRQTARLPRVVKSFVERRSMRSLPRALRRISSSPDPLLRKRQHALRLRDGGLFREDQSGLTMAGPWYREESEIILCMLRQSAVARGGTVFSLSRSNEEEADDALDSERLLTAVVERLKASLHL